MKSTERSLRSIINDIVANPHLHAKWLNTLSLMENSGARKIARFEHPVHTNIIMLKHAAEEARHAYYLKKQIAKLDIYLPDYSFSYLLAPMESYQFLKELDVSICRELSKRGLGDRDAMYAAYLLVTYAIEVRADMLYAVYQQALDEHKSKVNVKSIIVEEEGHLAEMGRMLEEFNPDWEKLASLACILEGRLFERWVEALKTGVSL